jgi:hypothetical protein
MASKTIFDKGEGEWAQGFYSAVLVRMSLSELLYHVLISLRAQCPDRMIGFPFRLLPAR